MTQQIPVNGLVLSDLRANGLYRREHEVRHVGNQVDGIKALTYDKISDAPISTEHANARFLVPHLAQRGWALFCDGDMLFRDGANVSRLFEQLDQNFAVYCVKHHYEPRPGTKMDGQAQTQYTRKNWSSFMVFNCGHPANAELTVDLVNSLPGRHLHRFCWLDDAEIGELDVSWNWLPGHSDPAIDPKVVHFTTGTPAMKGYENAPFADEWRAELAAWAR